jgi:hypothetical protein
VYTQGVALAGSDGIEISPAREATLAAIQALLAAGLSTSNGSTEATLLAVLAELVAKTEPADQQHVLVDNWQPASYLKKMYDIQNNVIFIGSAPRDTATNTAAWRIKRIDIDVNGNPTQVRWTEGSAIWDNRLSETYT